MNKRSEASNRKYREYNRGDYGEIFSQASYHLDALQGSNSIRV